MVGVLGLNLTENLGKSFDYAKKMFTDIGRLIVLIVLDVIPIVNWIVIGYGARVLRESLAQVFLRSSRNTGRCS